MPDPLVFAEELLGSDAEIPAAENRGDVEFFRRLLAPEFAMRRRTGDLVGGVAFLKGLKPGGTREVADGSTRPVMVSACRALIASKVGDLDEHGQPRATSNLRLYVRRTTDEPWNLLAWVNEPVD